MGTSQIIEILPSLRHICAKAECYLESHWADVISGPEADSGDEEAGKLYSSIY
jgi:nicotianamine synthase